MTKTKLSFVIPCYRSALTIADVVGGIEKTVAGRADQYDFEIILVNDCSPDDTFDVIRRITEEKPYVKAVNLARNFGQQSALMAGFHFVGGDIVVCLDDDGQTPPSECFKLVDKLQEGWDIVYAKYSQKKHSIFRNFGSAVNEIMAQHLLGKSKDIHLSSYYACKRFLIDEVIQYDNSYPYIAGLILRATTKIANVPVQHQQRTVGESGYTMRKLLALWMNGFTAFSVKPLRISTVMGAVFAALGVVFAVVIVIRKILYPGIAVGWSSLAALISVIGGLTLFMLGMIGEYVGRIYISLNKAPQYVVRETRNIDIDEKQ